MITPDKEYYRNLITSEYRLAPKFNAMVRNMVDYNCTMDRAVLKLVEMFDIDTAINNQLDILGACVGVSRDLKFEPTPVGRGDVICPTPEEMEKDTGDESIYTVYQTPIPAQLEDTQIIAGPSPADMDDAPLVTDDVYRTMIKARIIQNTWKGNVLDLYEVWHNLFPDNHGIQIQDLQDMSFNIVLIGDYSGLMKELILHGYIIPKPEGVRINSLAFISTDGLPIFAYDYNTLNYSGYKSHWLQARETGG
mgnify:FL=1